MSAAAVAAAPVGLALASRACCSPSRTRSCSGSPRFPTSLGSSPASAAAVAVAARKACSVGFQWTVVAVVVAAAVVVVVVVSSA